MAKRKPTEADLAAREEAQRNAAWLRELAERAYADLERRGKLTIPRPRGPFPEPTSAEMRAQREQARANSAWLRELAEKAKADLDRRKQQGT
jgi:DNA-binding transcriptional regulator YhcF (GntR family)